MKCPMKECNGVLEEKSITHAFVRHGRPFVVEGISARVCSVCGYTLLDLAVLDQLLAFNPEEEKAVNQAPVYRIGPKKMPVE